MFTSCSISFSFSGDSKQDSATTTSHNKRLILLVKEGKLSESSLSKIWENTDGCYDQYICALSLYLMSVMFKYYSVVIDRDISAPENCKEVVDGLNVIDKRYIYQLIIKMV